MKPPEIVRVEDCQFDEFTKADPDIPTDQASEYCNKAATHLDRANAILLCPGHTDSVKKVYETKQETKLHRRATPRLFDKD